LVYLQIIDHLIITKDGFYSFNMSGVLEELEHSKKYAVYFIEEAKLLEQGKKDGLEEGIEIGRMEEKIEMAKSLKKQKVEISIIVEASGLSIEEIEKL